MFATDIDLNHIIELKIIQELLTSFSEKFNVTIGAYNNHFDRQVLVSNLISDVDADTCNDLVSVIESPLAALHTHNALNDGKTLSFCDKSEKIGHTLFPIHFQDSLVLVVGVTRINTELLNPDVKVNGMLELVPVNSPDFDLIEPVDNIKKELSLFVEAGCQRYKLSSLSDDIEEIWESEHIIFTTFDKVILDTTPSLSQIMQTAEQSLIGLNVIDLLESLSDNSFDIRSSLQLLEDSNCVDLFVPLDHEFAITRIMAVPQFVGDVVLGYEYHLDVKEVNIYKGPQQQDLEKDAPQPVTADNQITGLDLSPMLVSAQEFKLFHAMPLPLVILDENLKIKIWNREMASVFNVPAQTTLGSCFEDFIAGTSLEKWQHYLQQVGELKSEQYIADEQMLFVHPDGIKLRVNFSLGKSRIQEKQYYLLIFNSYTVSGLDNSLPEELYNKYINEPNPVLITELNGKIVFPNSPAASLLDTDPGRLKKIMVQDLFTKDLTQAINSFKAGILPHGFTTVTNCKKEFANGRAFKLQAVVVEQARQSFIQWNMDARQDEKQSKNPSNLINKVQKLELLQQTLYNFSSNMEMLASDLYKHTSSIVLSETIDESTQSHLDELKSVVKKVSALKQNLIYFSNSEPPRFDEIDINEKINTWYDQLCELAGPDISIQLNLNDNIGPLRVNTRQIKHSLKTLIRNAAESYHEKGQIILHTRKHIESEKSHNALKDNNAYVVLEIIDSGRGIPVSIREKMFEPFNTNKPPQIGRGLGLASVYGIMKNHNGYITIKSLEDQGTIVSLYFPWIGERAESDKGDREIISKDKVLLIDDDPGIIEVNSITLKHFGFDIMSAETAGQGIELFQEHHQDLSLVIQDISLPDMEGIECAEALYNISQTVPFILSSGYHCTDIYYQFMLKTGTVFLQKPYTSNKLYQTIQSVLTRK